MFIALIDSVGSVAFPDCERKNRDRFRKFVMEFGAWKYASYFSLPSLQKHLREKTAPRFADLKNIVLPRYESWVSDERSIRELLWINVQGERQVISLDADMPATEVLKTTDQFNEEDRRDVDDLQDWGLLYRCRNALVHSFCVPGFNNRGEVLDYPYYEEYRGINFKTEEMEAYHVLVYPREFLHSLCRSVIINAAAHFREINDDPYPRMQESVAFYWVPKLNQGIGKIGQQMISTIRANRD